ncbi:uncharacterized protein PHALS_02087 [Plasmopara halstedii]|uniref:Uncharacterized protein n=1 Tax=Plasmopara halstedii TaxID=4781 RepID=A0A0P1AVL4_PLAHL|nr:uncharacterized protein PHALS_02087 [Plasmopara halstedii]CEG45815.1 hypothetical protein PHALS_02087 [Plasmopara halstedii]|eukprot:XP_024582184.1 hypothetical protein PHALS_02087 [Plasmopara halstedii]
MEVHDEDLDEVLCQVFRRCYGNEANHHTDSELLTIRQDDCQTLAVTNVADLANEIEATQQALHLKKPSMTKLQPLKIQPSQILTLKDLEDILQELHDLYERRDKRLLSQREQNYIALLTQAAVNCLINANPASRENFDAFGVPFRLLDVVIRPSPQWRRLAFILFFESSVALLAATLSRHDNHSATSAERLEQNLFHVLQDMVAKAIAVFSASQLGSTTSSSDWVDQAMGCLTFFIKKANGNYRSDRLRLLNEHTLIFLAAEASNRDPITSNLQLQVMEVIVATMYAHKLNSGNKSFHISTKDHTMWTCGLPVAIVEKYVSFELLMCFLISPFARLQRLIYMVFVDCVCDDIRRSGNREGISFAGLDQIWHTFVIWEDRAIKLRQALFSPYVSSARVAKNMALSCPIVSEKQLNVFVTRFRSIMQIDAYFGADPSLEILIKGAKNCGKSSFPNEVMSHISKLLRSSRGVERFRGERWLAELLCNDRGDDTFSSYDSKATTAAGSVRKQSEARLVRPKRVSAGAEQDKTLCSDENKEISVAAQATFWELSLSTNPEEYRRSFAKVLTLIVQRRLQLCSGKPGSVIKEVNTCLNVLLDYQESDATVLISMMLLILEICQCDLSYIDKRWKQQDRRNQKGYLHNRIASSDSLASQVLNGDVALNLQMLQQMDGVFFLHVLTVLHEMPSSHHNFECQGICCGVDDSLVGDVTACTALVVSHILSDNQTIIDRVGGLAALTPLMQVCDTRIAMFMAKLLSKVMKQTDEVQYATFLRELYVACIEADDEKALYNSYLHAQKMLHFGFNV